MSSTQQPDGTVSEAGWAPPLPQGLAPPTASVLHDIEALRDRLRETEDTLRAIRTGEVDALVIQGPGGPRTYTLVTADQAYRQLVEQMGEGALTLNPEGLILYCNPRFCTIVDVPMMNVTGRHLSEFWVDAATDLSQLLKSVDSAIAIGEVRLRRGDGTPVPVQLSLSNLATEAFTGVCAIVTDLSDRKRREAREADERLTRGILEHAAEGILLCDHAGRIIRANAIAVSLCGHDPVGRVFGDVCARAVGFKELVASTHAGKRRELRYERADGTEFYLSVGARAVQATSAGAGAMFVVTLADITERRRAEAERDKLFEAERAARADAEAANRAKTEFLGVMSHELRTPLNAIIGHEQLVASGIYGPVTDEQRAALARIQQSAGHLLRLIDSLLSFVRIEAGHVEYSTRSVAIAELLSIMDSLIQPQVQSKQLVYECRTPEEADLAVHADREKALQILLNLVANAVKFTPATGRIRLQVEAVGARVLFHVSDTGIGVPPDQLENIFDPFVQVDRRLTCGNSGVGLGLAISRDLARGMGGDLTVESESGSGSTFTLALPQA
jgi:PAS domain S-box-containing protein